MITIILPHFQNLKQLYLIIIICILYFYINTKANKVKQNFRSQLDKTIFNVVFRKTPK